MLKVTELDPSEELDRSLDALRPAIDRFFGVTPVLRWSNNPTEGGSLAVPQLGITLNRPQIVSLRARLDAGTFEQVMRYVLAHETAHMAQYRVYSVESVLDTTKTRPVECQADILAGMATANILSDMQVPPPEFLKSVQPIVALAFEVGHPSWDDPTHHPRPDQRLVCASMGVNAGLHLRLVQQYELTRNPDLLRQINEWRARDSSWFKPGDDVWQWTNARAKALVHFGDAYYVPPGGAPDLLGAFRRIASAAERGTDAMRRNRALLVIPGPTLCEFNDRTNEVEVVCRDRIAYPSSAVARASFGWDRDMLRGALVMGLGWTESAGVSDTEIHFARRGASAVLRLDEAARIVEIRFAGKDLPAGS